jgi:hypothetical protein
MPHPGHHPPMLSLGKTLNPTPVRIANSLLARSANYAKQNIVRSLEDRQRSSYAIRMNLRRAFLSLTPGPPPFSHSGDAN